MTIETKKYSRRPFDVEAIRVTKTNMDGVAEWCGGNVIDVEGTETIKAERFIQVDVHAPANERQSRAFPGDYVLLLEGGKSFKVYTTKAFNKNFVLSTSTEETPAPATRTTRPAAKKTPAAKQTPAKPANGIKPDAREALRKMGEGAQKANDAVIEKAQAVVDAFTQAQPTPEKKETVEPQQPAVVVETKTDPEGLNAAAEAADRTNILPGATTPKVEETPEAPKKRKFIQQTA